MNKISTIRLIIFISIFTSINFHAYAQCLTDTVIYYEKKYESQDLFMVRRSIFQYNSANQITEESDSKKGYGKSKMDEQYQNHKHIRCEQEFTFIALGNLG